MEGVRYIGARVPYSRILFHAGSGKTKVLEVRTPTQFDSWPVGVQPISQVSFGVWASGGDAARRPSFEAPIYVYSSGRLRSGAKKIQHRLITLVIDPFLDLTCTPFPVLAASIMVMVNSFYGRGSGRILAIAVALLLVTGILLFSTGTDSISSLRSSRLCIGASNSEDAPKHDAPKKDGAAKEAPTKEKPPAKAGPAHPKGISYDVTTPPTVGCEDLVNDLQQELIRSYSKLLKGVRYANIWGYLETENKGDAAIWTAQQILLTMMGIETMEACRYESPIPVFYYSNRANPPQLC